MDIIGKKTVLKIGGKLPKDNENEIIGESTIVHVPESEIGRHKRIIGTESKVIIGDDDKKDK